MTITLTAGTVWAAAGAFVAIRVVLLILDGFTWVVREAWRRQEAKK